MPSILFIVLHAVSGVYAGACVAIAAVFVPFLSALDEPVRAVEASRLLLERMGTLMLPQLLVMSALCLWASIAALIKREALRAHAPLAVLASVWLVSVTFHFPINAAIFEQHVVVSEVIAQLPSWERWHYLRTALALALPPAVMWSRAAKAEK